jgi:hypothetical protein
MRFKSILKRLILENTSRFKMLYDKLVIPSEEDLRKNPNAKGKLAGSTITKLNNQTNELEQVQLTPFQVLKQIIFADPTTTPCATSPCMSDTELSNFDIDGASIEDMEKVKVGEYTNWILSYYAAKLPNNIKELDPKSPEYKKAVTEYRRLFIEDLSSLKTNLIKFHQLKKYKNLLPPDKKDINKLTKAEFEDVCMNYQIPEKNLNKQAKKEAEKIEGDSPYSKFGCPIIFEGKDWVVVEINPNKNPNARFAAVFYGGQQKFLEGESKWCTSAPGNARTRGEKDYISHFDFYTSQYIDAEAGCKVDSPLYVILPKNDGGNISPISGLPKNRYQFNFAKEQFMDLLDNQIDLGKYFGQNGIMREIFDGLPIFRKGFEMLFKKYVMSSSEEAIITYPSSKGIFEIFGFEALIDKLPANIKILQLINSTKDQKRAFEIPDSIGRFTELTSLVFDASAKNIPSTVSNLKNLAFLSILNCPLVKQLPESISELEELNFIVLRGSNPMIPPVLKEKLIERKDGMFYVQ